MGAIVDLCCKSSRTKKKKKNRGNFLCYTTCSRNHFDGSSNELVMQIMKGEKEQGKGSQKGIMEITDIK